MNQGEIVEEGPVSQVFGKATGRIYQKAVSSHSYPKNFPSQKEKGEITHEEHFRSQTCKRCLYG